MSRKAVFLDKDGTLVENVPYNVDPDAVRLAPGAGEGLRQLAALGFEFAVVSNQSGVARGYFPENALLQVEERIRWLLRRDSVDLLGFHYCPHHPDGAVPKYRGVCACRKPSPGLIHTAAERHGISLGESWLIGDILDDVEAGNRAGVRTVLLLNGGETEWDMSRSRRPVAVARDLREAAACIAGASARGRGVLV